MLCFFAIQVGKVIFLDKIILITFLYMNSFRNIKYFIQFEYFHLPNLSMYQVSSGQPSRQLRLVPSKPPLA